MNQNTKVLKLDVIKLITDTQAHLSLKDVEDAVNCIIEQIAEALETGQRVEVRGFGAFFTIPALG